MRARRTALRLDPSLRRATMRSALRKDGAAARLTVDSRRKFVGRNSFRHLPQAEAAVSGVGSPRARTSLGQRDRPFNLGDEHVRKNDSAASRVSCSAGARLSSLLGRGGGGEVAASERIYLQGPPDGRQSRRYVQDVVHQFLDGPSAFVRRSVSRARSERTAALFGQ